MEPMFTPVPCESCNQTILKLSEAYHTRVIDIDQRKSYWAWKHRKCMNLAQK
jgi:DNA-directed RNA polymerase subunit N (RpoN/RPB10)